MDRSQRYRIVVTGHAGLQKETCLTNLCQYIYNQDPTWKNFAENEEAQKNREKELAQWYEAEKNLKPIVQFLTTEWYEQIPKWYYSISTAIARCNSDNPKYAFLSLHLTYRWKSDFISPVSWRIPIVGEHGVRKETSIFELIKNEFKPNCFITLIDDIHYVQKRIKRGIYLRLRELLNWRNIETIFTDLMAREIICESSPTYNALSFPFEHSPVVAIRHPSKMFFDLLFGKSDLPRIYASFPISRTRDNKIFRDEIDRFRNILLSKFVVYDPLTIDERPLQGIYEKNVESENIKDHYSISMDDRWPIPADRTLCNEEPKEVSEISWDEIKEISTSPQKEKSEIDRSIESRDFRLIDQSDFLVAYRPCYKSANFNFSGGTRDEIKYAIRRSKPFFIIHDSEEDGPFTPKTFDIEPINSTFIIDEIKSLSKQENQEKALNILIDRIKEIKSELTAERLRNF